MRKHPATDLPTTALRGWRASWWSLVLFIALFRGLVPHAALAGALMPGDPAQAWCSPRLEATDLGGAAALSTVLDNAHDCVCAGSGDSALPTGVAASPQAGAGDARPLPAARSTTPRRLVRPPPARGPPAV